MALPALPSGWQNYNPSQKIDWFNANQVDEGTLRNYASQADIDWMKSQGYQGSYEPIETEAVTGVKPGGLASVASQPVYTPKPVYTPEPVVTSTVTPVTVTPATGALSTATAETSGTGALASAVESKTDTGGTYTEDRYNPDDPASSRYIADPNAGQYVFDPVTGKHTLEPSTGATSVVGATGNDTVTGALSTAGNQAVARSTASRSDTRGTGALAIVGDSLSSALGYDSTANSVGSLSDVFGSNVTNISRGGMTTTEALTGRNLVNDQASAFANTGGTFQSFLNSSHPDKVVLRYGAADAAIMRDPKTTISNLDQMIQMAIASGSTPVLTGIPPVATSGDPRHGGVYGNYFDFMPPLVEEINQGMQQLANKYGLQFIDLSGVQIPKGGLLDGLHPDAATGAIIANEIKRQLAGPSTVVGATGNDTVTGALSTATGPVLGADLADLSNETEAVTGVKPGVDFRASTTAAENFLMAADPNIQQAFFKPGSSDRYNGTFVETFKVENGKLTPIQATPQDIASGNVLFYVGGAPGGDYAGENRVAQAYMMKNGQLTPVGEAKPYTAPKETPFFKEFLIEGVLPMLLAAAGGSGIAETLGGALSGGALTGASAASLGSGALNLGAQLLRGVDPMDAIKTTVLTGGVNAAANSLGALLPAEFAAAGKNILSQLINTGRIDPMALVTSVGMSAASDVIAAETGLDKNTATSLLNAGYKAVQGDLTGAATSLLQSGALSTLSSGATSSMSPQDRDAFVEANASPLGLSALSPNPTEDQLIDFENRTTAANQLLTDYTASGSDISRDNAIARLTSLGVPAAKAQELITNADAQVEQRRVASDVMNRYAKIDPEFGTPQLDRQIAKDEMVAAGIAPGRADELLNGVDAQNAIKLENKLGVQAAYQNLLKGTGGEDALRSAMTSAGYTDADINSTVTRARGVIEGGKLTSGEQAQVRAENLPDVRADIAGKSTFSDAYALAREKLGAGATFTWQGKNYSTATFQEDPKLGLVLVAGSGRGTAMGKTVEQEAALENTRQQLLAAQTAAKPTGLISSIGNWLSNQMQLSSEAAQNYLKNNPNSPITQSVSTAYDAAGELLRNVGGGTALLMNNKPLADEFVRSGGDLQKFGQSIGSGPQDTANFNETMQLLNAAQGVQEKLAVLGGRILDGTSGLARQTVIELRQELPALFIGGAGAKAALIASGLIDTADTAGGAALDAYDSAVKSGKTHDQALVDARRAGAAAGATEAAIQLTIGKLGELAVGKLNNVVGKATGRVIGEGLTEGGQEAGASVAVDLALGQGVDLNKALTQGIIGSAIGKSTSLATAPVSTAQDITTALEASKASGVSSVESITTTVNAALSSGVNPGTVISTVTGSGLTSANDVSTLTASVIKGSTGDVTANVGSTVTAAVGSAIANGGAVSSTITAAVGSSVTAGVQAGGNMASVVSSATSSAITSAVSGGASVEAATVAAVGSAISTGIKSGGNTGAVITAAVGSAITSSNGDAEAVSSSLQTAASTALSAGASATDVTTATISAAVAGGVNAATAASSAIAGVVAGGGDLSQAVAAAEAATGANIVTSQTDGKTVITSTDGNIVTKTVVDPASNVTITSTTDLSTNKTTTTIADTGVQQQIDALQQSVADINTNLSTAINDAVKSGQTGDAALQTAINKVASDLGTSKTDLLAQIGKTEAALQTQFSSQLQAVGTQLSDLESRLMKEINSARQAGVTGDAALQTAINKVAGDLGTTKTDLLSQIGKTESALKNQFTTQLGDVSTSLNAAIQSAIAQGKTADTALSESISKVASDLGLTKDQLLQQIGKTETALKSDVKTLSDTVTKINTDLSTEIKSVLKTTQDADAVLNTSINKVASDLGITKDQLLNQIGKTESQLKSEIQTTQNTITQVKTDLTTEIYNAAQTSADADKIITESVKKVADDLGLTKEELLDKIGETELSLKAELSTELAKVSQELGKQIKGIKTGLANQAALAAASQVFRGAASPEDWLGGKLLATKQTGGYQDPLAQFQALQEDAQRMELLQQVAPELADVLTERGMPLPHYSYGDEQPIDDILATEEEPVYRSGGSVSPLNIQMMYAKGGHAREDFRHGKHVEGPGDGQSDDIPAWLADGEFVFPADVVAALGNGSTKAGTDKLYDMMHAIRHRARSKGPKDLPPPALKSPLDYLKYRK